jgi:large subunit ribosomal protein L35
MPKVKTRRAAAKRFKKTGSGKIARTQGWKGHRLINRTRKQKRRVTGLVVASDADQPKLKRMLPYL